MKKQENEALSNRDNMAEAEPDARCRTCLYSALGEIDPNDLKAGKPLFCKRFPVVSQFVFTPGGLANMVGSPRVHPDDWCGEHEMRGSQSPGMGGIALQ